MSPVTRGLPSSAIHDEILRTFRNVRIEIVHEHAQRAFRLPALGIELYAARRADDTLIVQEAFS